MPSPHRPPASTGAAASFCEPHRAFIEAQLRLGRNAMAIYQELVDGHGFAGRYNSVKRFVARTRVREPEQFDRLSFLPGEEMQVVRTPQDHWSQLPGSSITRMPRCVTHCSSVIGVPHLRSGWPDTLR